MLKEMVAEIKQGLLLLLILSGLTGLAYPLLVTRLAQVLFPWQANGSIITQQGKPIGSLLIGQSFTSTNYFWGRPSATQPFPYNGASSGADNLAASNPVYLSKVRKRLAQFANETLSPPPIDLLTASASGLDPDISEAAAYYQIPRIAKVRHLRRSTLETLVAQHIQQRTFDLLGEPRVNLLLLNLALDQLESDDDRRTTQP